MFTDTVGYTASTHTDEARTLESLREQEDLVRPLISIHHGREIKSTGDGFLVEFDSALKATHCAVDIQRRIYERNAEGALAPIQIRIGIHLGDVVQRGTDILGDAVNIAARIEPVAEPGGICLSGAVREQVWNKITDKLEKLPPTALKGLPVPMDIYRVVLPWTVRELSSASSAPPGLAVLPFSNISPDPKDEYFADGLTEEMITVLSRLRELRVIARTSVMQYKSTSKPVSQIGAELRVSSILEGSVRKAGNRLRITAQLIDVGSQGHVWADTYDRELDDVFAVQADIARQVAEALKIELRADAGAPLESKPKVRLDSYLAYLKGRNLWHSHTRDSLEAAKEQFELAISLDDRNAAAHSGLADAFFFQARSRPDDLRVKLDEKGRRSVARAIELDPNLAEAHASLALVRWDDFDPTVAEKEFKLALSLNPSYSEAHHWYAEFLEGEGRPDEALEEFALAEAADPLWPNNLSCWALLLIWLGRLDEALVKIRKYESLRFGELESFREGYHSLLASYYRARSDIETCIKELHRLEEVQSEPRWKHITQALCCALSGEKEEATSILRYEETLPEVSLMTSVMAQVYAELGDLGECFRLLERVVENEHVFAFHIWRMDPRFEHVRRDPRFQVLLRKMNLA
jgi:adenylate cyclase